MELALKTLQFSVFNPSKPWYSAVEQIHTKIWLRSLLRLVKMVLIIKLVLISYLSALPFVEYRHMVERRYLDILLISQIQKLIC